MAKLTIGITGGIGSGKSIICRIFETFQIPVYEADSRAKWLMAHDPELRKAIQEEFGQQTYDENKQLNRTYLASQVFHDSQRLQKLNSLVHPQVGKDFVAWVQSQNQAPYVLNEAALMFESGRYLSLDKVITVFAPIEVRTERVAKRDPHRDREEIKAIMQKQMPEEEKMAKAHYIIHNDDKQLVIPQVLAIHQELTALAEKK